MRHHRWKQSVFPTLLLFCCTYETVAPFRVCLCTFALFVVCLLSWLILMSCRCTLDNGASSFRLIVIWNGVYLFVQANPLRFRYINTVHLISVSLCYCFMLGLRHVDFNWKIIIFNIAIKKIVLKTWLPSQLESWSCGNLNYEKIFFSFSIIKKRWTIFRMRKNLLL